MRVGLHVEQLRRPIPGGIGTYVRALVDELPGAGVELSTFASGPGDPAWPDYRDLGRPRPPLREVLWQTLRRPRVHLDVDLVHAPSLSIPPSGRTPFAVTVHDVAFLRVPEAFPPRGIRFHRRGLRIARKRAHAVIAPSAFTCSELVEEGFDPSRLFVAPHGIPAMPSTSSHPPIEADAMLAMLGIAPPFVLAVGTIEPRKGFRTVFAAFAELKLRGVTLVVAGPRGWGDVPVPHDIVALGAVDRTTLDALYRRASACVVPSRYEGFGLPALEAMAHGAPVIASDITSLPEVVGDAGVLVPVDDVDAWAEAIAGVVGDPERRRRLGDAGLRRAGEFTWARSAATHVDAYRTALAAR